MQRSDEQIKQDAINHLVWDAGVDASCVKVGVRHGVVTVEGRVPSLRARESIYNGLIGLRGVRAVKNDVNVERMLKLPDVGDPDIAERAQQMLEWDSEIDENAVSIQSEDGQVTLEGSVDSLWKKKEIGSIVYRIDGVCNVDNRLIVVPTEKPEDAKIAQDILDALERNELAAPHEIDVEVADGVVTLRGCIKSWIMWRAICDVAERTRGVKEVVEKVDPDE